MQQSSSNPQIVLALDENAMIKRIQATHGPENHEINTKPLLDMIKYIVELCNSAPGEYRPCKVEPLSKENLGNMREHLAYKINSISSEILGNCSGGQDAQETILALFTALSAFRWNAKGVIALAAFAVNYGEVCLIAQLHNNDPIAKSIAVLEQLPEVLNSFESSIMKKHMAELTKELLDLNKCVCEFKGLPKQYIKSDAPELVNAEAQFPTAIYWTIRSIVICQSQILNLTSTGFEYIASATEAWELSYLIDKVKQLASHLQKQLHLCYQHVEENRVKELYQTIANLFEVTHDDNFQILKILMGEEDVLFNGLHKSRASVESLRNKTVLLYISGLQLSQAELSHIKEIYGRSQGQEKEFDDKYDVVWLPIVDKPLNQAQIKLFDSTRDTLLWFSLLDPSLLDTAVIEYIKNVWHFEKTSMIVTLNEKGKVVNSNAMHMMFIWGYKAYPFTGTKEEQLWAAETWRLELLVDSIEPINEWIEKGIPICLYGGEDMEWIRKFTIAANSVADSASIPFEIMYMGTSNPKEKVQTNKDTIRAENLKSIVFQDLNQIWLFWFRLESMWHSRVQRGMSPETDRIIQEIFLMHSFDCSGRGWAIFSRGSDEIAKAMGDTMLNCLSEFDQWKNHAAEKGFVTALNEHIHQITNLEGCNRLSWPVSAGIPEKMVCFECGRLMMKTITFTCCTQ